MSWQRLLFILSLAVVEVAPAALLVTIAGGNVWALLLVVALLGALLGRLVNRWLPERTERPVLLGLGLLLGMLAFAAVSESGWNVAAAVSEGDSFAYITLVATLYVFWRGTLLTEHDSVSVGRFFNRAVVGIVAILGLGALGNALRGEANALAGLELISFFVGGLLAIALAHMTNSHNKMSQIGWRSVATLLATITLVVFGGVFAATLLGGSALMLLGAIVQGVGLLVALALAPFAFAFAWFFEQFSAVMGNSDFAQILAQQAQQMSEAGKQLSMQGDPPAWVGIALNTFCFVVPLVLLATLILLRRRQNRARRSENEQRESLLSWAGIRADLGDLFGNLLGRNSDKGLRAALARLSATDPASRIRRAYIRLLLHAEARERTRTASQTPHEFAPSAATATNARQSVETLTRTYERARYAPTTATPTQAESAEQAWKQIEGGS